MRVHIIDDDDAVRNSLGMMLQTVGMEVETFPSGDDYLSADVNPTGIVTLLDIRMPGTDGLQVLDQIILNHPKASVVMISGHGDIATAVGAIQSGAHDFIEKPFSARRVIDVVERVAQDAAATPSPLDLLSPREREIAVLLADGKANKVIAHELSISIRTVETHRSRLMSKLAVRSLAELVRLVISSGN